MYKRTHNLICMTEHVPIDRYKTCILYLYVNTPQLRTNNVFAIVYSHEHTLTGNVVLSRLKHTQASVGAACHSSSVATPSPCLLAVGVTTEVALNALRLSVGRETSTGDVDVVVADLKNAVFELTGN